jgi:hypothetical protein
MSMSVAQYRMLGRLVREDSTNGCMPMDRFRLIGTIKALFRKGFITTCEGYWTATSLGCRKYAEQKPAPQTQETNHSTYQYPLYDDPLARTIHLSAGKKTIRR